MLTDWVQIMFCLPQPTAFLIVIMTGFVAIEGIHYVRRRKK